MTSIEGKTILRNGVFRPGGWAEMGRGKGFITRSRDLCNGHCRPRCVLALFCNIINTAFICFQRHVQMIKN